MLSIVLLPSIMFDRISTRRCLTKCVFLGFFLAYFPQETWPSWPFKCYTYWFKGQTGTFPGSNWEASHRNEMTTRLFHSAGLCWQMGKHHLVCVTGSWLLLVTVKILHCTGQSKFWVQELCYGLHFGTLLKGATTVPNPGFEPVTSATLNHCHCFSCVLSSLVFLER